MILTLTIAAYTSVTITSVSIVGPVEVNYRHFATGALGTLPLHICSCPPTKKINKHDFNRYHFTTCIVK